MKRIKLTKVAAGTLIAASIIALNPIGASAEWIQDRNNCWWYSEGDSWATDWREIDGKWYHFDRWGYMERNKDVDGWYLDNSGAGTECIKAGDFDILKSTSGIVKYNKKVPWGPGKTGIPLVIPRNIGGIEINSIGNKAFSDCQYITYITIPDSVTSIGDSAFERCVSLQNMTIPDSVTSIGNDAFESCNRLKNITIPNSVRNIGQGAFLWCTNLTSITIPDGITSINNWVFSNCTSLRDVKIPNSVISIKQSAFSKCTNLTNVIIPNSVTSIGDTAFSGCSNLASVTIPDSVESIGRQAFYGCANTIFYVQSEKVKQLLINKGVSTSQIALNSK